MEFFHKLFRQKTNQENVTRENVGHNHIKAVPSTINKVNQKQTDTVSSVVLTQLTPLLDASKKLSEAKRGRPTSGASDDQYEFEYSLWENNYKKVLRQVTEIIIDWEETRNIDLLVKALKDNNSEIRALAAEALGRIGDVNNFGSLSAALRDSDMSVKIAAAGALGQIGDVRAVEPLVSVILNYNDSRMEKVYIAAVNALMKIGDTNVVRYFAVALSNNDIKVRRAAAKALGNLGGDDAVDVLIKALADSDGDVRYNAIRSLGNIGNTRAVIPLIAALKDDVIYARAAAAEALGNIGDTRAVDPLGAALKEWDKYEIRHLTEALDKLHNQKK